MNNTKMQIKELRKEVEWIDASLALLREGM